VSCENLFLIDSALYVSKHGGIDDQIPLGLIGRALIPLTRMEYLLPDLQQVGTEKLKTAVLVLGVLVPSELEDSRLNMVTSPSNPKFC
jgi:hypothetical protein